MRILQQNTSMAEQRNSSQCQQSRRQRKDELSLSTRAHFEVWGKAQEYVCVDSARLLLAVLQIRQELDLQRQNHGQVGEESVDLGARDNLALLLVGHGNHRLHEDFDHFFKRLNVWCVKGGDQRGACMFWINDRLGVENPDGRKEKKITNKKKNKKKREKKKKETKRESA